MTTPPNNVLSFMDQASLFWVQVSGHVHCIQATWVYRRDIDLDGLRRTQDNLAHGLLGRRIECSPLPTGRHRWVSWHEPPPIDVAEPVSSLEALTKWTAQRGQVPIDAAAGPPWHFGVLPIEGYGTAVSLVVSHTVIDGVGTGLVLAAAVKGIRRDFGYPPPRARSRWGALAQDTRLAVAGLPEAARALVGGAKLARRTSKELAAKPPPEPAPVPHGAENTPTDAAIVRVFIDPDHWDSRAAALGGTQNSLFAAFAARLAHRVGRVRPEDGAVTVTFPVNARTEDDTNGNPIRSVDVTVDPAAVTTDLRAVRADIKQALKLGLGNFKEQEVALPLIPWTPKLLARKLVGQAVGANAYPVGCANMGELDPAVACVDGTPADTFWMNLVGQNLTHGSLELKYGEMLLSGGRLCGKMFIGLRSYQPGKPHWRRELCGHIADTFADFELTGVIE